MQRPPENTSDSPLTKDAVISMRIPQSQKDLLARLGRPLNLSAAQMAGIAIAKYVEAQNIQPDATR